jgi:vacuolar-type H+-ATPase subunit E/Vma4
VRSEKLEKFSQVVLREAQVQKGSKIEDCESKINEAVKKIENETKRASSHYLHSEIRKVITANTKRISDEQVTLLQEISHVRTEIENNIMDNVTKRINEFVLTKEYEDWLSDIVVKSVKNYDPKDIIVYINNTDERLIGQLNKITTANIKVANEHFIGGVKIVCESKRTVLNNTILEGLKDARENLQNEVM